MSSVTIEHYTERQQRSAQRVLDTLDQMDSRLSPHYSAKRQHSRRAYRGVGTLCFVDVSQPTIEFSKEKCCEVWIRAVSLSGLSFIYPEEILTKQVLFGLKSASGETTWFVAEIVRSRSVVEEGFWEYGVKFLRRAVFE